MALIVGTLIPDISLFISGLNGPEPVRTGDLFARKRLVLFGLPGAFTPTCSTRHLPGYIEKAPAFKDAGIDLIICMSVNDAFVMSAWAKQQNVGDQVVMLADGNGDFAAALGVARDMTARGMGHRCQRFALVVNDLAVEEVFVEPAGGFGISSAEHVLSKL